MKKLLRQVLPVLLAFTLLAYVLRGMPLANLLDQFQKASRGWVAITAFVMAVQTVLRAIRWRMLLQGLGYTPSVGRAMSAMLAGSASGLILPGSGELLRCTLLQRSDNVPITESIGSVITERFVDLLATAVFLTVTLLVESGRLLAYAHQYMQPPAWLLAITPRQWVVAVVVLGVSLLLSFWGLRRLVQHAVVQRIAGRLRLKERVSGLRRGLLSIRQVPNPGLYWLTTFITHGLSLVLLLSMFRALPISAGLPASATLTVYSLSSLGSLTIPTQASIGTYHFLASRCLVAYGLPLQAGIIWATFSHAIITVVNLVFSVLGFLAALRFLREKEKIVAVSDKSVRPV